MSTNHIHAERVSALVANREPLTLEERRHVESCDYCRGWLVAISELASNTTAKMTLEIPPPRKPASD
jgi:hypothetical protein